MKILILSDINNVHTKKWVKSICDSGIEVSLFGLSAPKDEYYKNIKNLEVNFSDFSNLYGGSVMKKISYLKVVKQLKLIYKDFKPDLVHAHYATSYGLLGSFLKHKPYLISVWGSDVFEFPRKSKLNKKILQRNFKKADYIFSTSHIMAKESRLYTNKNIDVVPFGVDLDKFSPQKSLNRSSDKLVIGIVKTLEKNYGIDFLLKAFSEIIKQKPNQNLQLLIVGGGRLLEEYKELSISLGIEKKVVFEGRVDHSLIPEYLNKMDIVAFPSRIDSESFGVAAVEASACEKPIVVSRVGGLPEVIIDYKTGLICEPENHFDLADKIEHLIENPELRLEMGKNGREFVKTLYSWDDNVKTMIQHYQKIFSSSC